MPKFPVLKEGLALVNTSLFLPKSRVAAGPVIRALTFGIDPNEPPRTLVIDHPHHLEVPRNYRTVEELESRGIDVVDLRPSEFDTIELEPIPGFEFRNHQKPAWEAMRKALEKGEDFILRLDTGRGKTVMGWRAAAEVKAPTLVISAQKAHLSNWEKELHKLFILNGKVGWISGKKLEWEADVVLSTVQTLVKRVEAGKLPPDFGQRFGLVIYDEVHHQAAKWFSKASDLVRGQRIGLTATLNRRDRCEGVITSHLGRVVYDDPSEDTLTPTIYCHETPTRVADDDPRILDVLHQPNISKLRSFLAQETPRNKQIVDVARDRLSEGRKVYMLSHSKDHVFLLADELRRRGLTPGVITGDEKDADERLRQLNEYDVVVATVHVGKEAYNREALSSLILATPMGIDNHAPTEWVQSVGRILRPVKGKPDPRVDIFGDTGVTSSIRMHRALLRWCYRNNWPVVGDLWTREATRRRRMRRSSFRA